MLSDKVLSSAKDAAHYFIEQDNYYVKGSQEALNASAWLGKGAEQLGLSGTVDPDIFTRLLEGQLPNGVQVGKLVDGEVKHRPGFDLTFSAPKSVSILAEVGGDTRIYAAHDKATRDTLAQIERYCAQARKFEAGQTTFENTENIVAASFRHDTSRELDPQLHTHCVVMNVTQRKDGQWRSLASDIHGYQQGTNGFIERVRDHKIHYGTLYRAALAYELKELGYEITKTHADGRFEVVGVPEDAIKHFSKRRNEIEAFMKEKGWEGAKAAAFVTLGTRNAKSAMDRDTLHAEWTSRADSLGVDVKSLVDHAMQKQAGPMEKPVPTAPDANIQHAIDFAIAHLSETDVSLSHHKILNTAVTQLLGDIKVDVLMQAIDQAVTDKHLIPLESQNGERLYTTSNLLKTEQALLAQASRGQYQVLPWANKVTLNNFEALSTLSDEQQQALTEISQGYDRVQLLTGVSGSGKTTVLRNIATLARQQKMSSVYLTPSQAQAKQWRHNYGKPQTVTAFLLQAEHALREHRPFQKPSMILVDHAQLLSAKQLLQLTQLAETMGSRVVLAGDDKSLLSRSAGCAFGQMIDHGIKAARLTEIQRSINRDQKAAIHDTLSGHIDQSLAKIEHRLLEVRDKPERLQAMAAHYVASPQDSLVLVNSARDVEQVNRLIREGLQTKGELSKTSVIKDVYLPKSLSNTEMTSAMHYQTGWQLRFNQTANKGQIGKYEYWQIQSIDKVQNQMVLCNAKGKTTSWSPKELMNKPGKVEVFSQEKRAMAVGECLQTTRANRDKGFYSGEKLMVLAIDAKSMTVKNSQGRVEKLNAKEIRYHHLDYGYATTPHKSHHIEAKTLIAQHDTGQTTQRQFYKALSQASDHVWLYTDDKQAYLHKLKSHTGNKSTAIDALLAGKVAQSHRTTWVVDPHKPLASQTDMLQQQLHSIVEQVSKIVPDLPKTPEDIAVEATRYAMAQLGEREAAFAHKELLTTALKQVLGNVNPSHIEQAIADIHVASGLVPGKGHAFEDVWTTQAAIEMERDVLHTLKSGVGNVPPLLDVDQARTLLAPTILGADQRQAAIDILTTQDRFTLLQAPAGSGKTTLMEFVKHFAETCSDQGYRVVGVAPSDTAVGELNKRGVPTQTMASFLMEIRAQYETKTLPDLSKTIFILDESSMSSTRGFLELARYVSDTNARCVPIGDKDQLASPEAGKPFELSQKAGVKTTQLTEIYRQDADKVALKEAVTAVMAKQYGQSLAALNKQTSPDQEPFSLDVQNAKGKTIKVEPPRLIEIKDKNDRIGSMVDDFLARDPERRERTLLVVPKNTDRQLANELLRDGLKTEGVIDKKGVVVDVLTPRHLTYIDASRATNYEAGDVLRFNRSLPHVGITRLSYLTVDQVDILSNALVLTNADKSQRFLWALPSHEAMPKNLLEVYSREEREVCVGDVVGWTRSDKSQGFKNGSQGTVISVSKQSIGLRFDDGLIKEIATDNPTHQHWDYSYAVTAYKSQGKTTHEVISNADSRYKKLTTQRELYVVITRAKQQVTLYTDNAQQLQKQITKATGDKYSALEVIREVLDRPSASVKSVRPTEASIQRHGKTSSVKDPIRNQSTKATEVRDSKKVWDSEDIKAKLTDQSEHIVRALLGEPKKVSGDTWRYGSKSGSLVVTMQGEKRGLWHDFQTGEGGSLLNLIAKEYGHSSLDSFAQTLDVAASLLGLSDAMKTSLTDKKVSTKSPHEQQATKAVGFTPKQLNSIAFAQKIVSDSVPIKGTLAEQYLREHRKITTSLPDQLRFHPGLYSKANQATMPAMIAVATNEHGAVQAVQATFLDLVTANKAKVEVVKQSFGPTKGALVWLQQGKAAAPMMCAEGVETSLSLKEADADKAIVVTLGASNLLNIKTSASSVVLALDNDGNNPATKEILNNAIRRLQEQGKSVYTQQPVKLNTDFNDVLKDHGVSAVRQAIDSAKEVPVRLNANDNRITTKQFDKAFNEVSLKHDEFNKPPRQAEVRQREASVAARTLADQEKMKKIPEMKL